MRRQSTKNWKFIRFIKVAFEVSPAISISYLLISWILLNIFSLNADRRSDAVDKLMESYNLYTQSDSIRSDIYETRSDFFIESIASGDDELEPSDRIKAIKTQKIELRDIFRNLGSSLQLCKLSLSLNRELEVPDNIISDTHQSCNKMQEYLDKEVSIIDSINSSIGISDYSEEWYNQQSQKISDVIGIYKGWKNIESGKVFDSMRKSADLLTEYNDKLQFRKQLYKIFGNLFYIIGTLNLIFLAIGKRDENN